jgi:hypothetical protein
MQLLDFTILVAAAVEVIQKQLVELEDQVLVETHHLIQPEPPELLIEAAVGVELDTLRQLLTLEDQV